MLTTKYFISKHYSQNNSTGTIGNDKALEDVIRQRDTFLKANATSIAEIVTEKVEIITLTGGIFSFYALLTLSYYPQE